MALLRSGTRIYGNATIDTVLHIDGSNAATDANTGAVVLSNGGLGVHGNIYSGAGIFATDATITGNLTVGGNLAYINVTNSYLKDPLIELGGNSNGGILTSNDNKDRGSLLHYYDGRAVDAFIGWKSANSEFTVASNVSVANNVVTINELGNIRANMYYGNGSQLTGIVSKSLVISNISNIVAGSAISITVDNANATYPGGVFTLEQLGPISLNVTDQWNQSGANVGTSKNAYANYISNTVNTSNIKITLSLANATFNINAASDTITFGSSIITGANLTALGITGTGGTYTIPSTYLTAANTQTNSSVAASVSLTTNRNTQTGTGTSLTNNQPVPFNITALSGTFPSSTVPYWSLNQTFNWNATTTSGATVNSGNVSYANSAQSISGSLTSSGQTSNTSPSLDSTLTYTISSSDYVGAGQYGAGTRQMTSTVNGTVNPATKYYPLFWKITNSSSLPTFTTSDSHNSNNYALGQSANTSTTPTDYLWMATPTSASHTFKHIFLGSDIVDTPDVTGTTTISGYTYSIWGFTDFSAVAAIITTT